MNKDVQQVSSSRNNSQLTSLLAAQVADFNLSRVMEASSMQSSLAATNPRYAELMADKYITPISCIDQ